MKGLYSKLITKPLEQKSKNISLDSPVSAIWKNGMWEISQKDKKSVHLKKLILTNCSTKQEKISGLFMRAAGLHRFTERIYFNREKKEFSKVKNGEPIYKADAVYFSEDGKVYV